MFDGQRNLRVKLDELGVAMRALDGIFAAEYLDEGKPDYVGKRSNVDTFNLQSHIMVVGCTEKGDWFHSNGDKISQLNLADYYLM
ncbi:unnamed protein product [Clonostachys rosea]|uniref:Peptidase M28 domain-containing protein n=1 Tax=Bionectria ochroleuca TaxID=29856 RepID=A0ABY6UVX8_BIOOC|nr:unnamed protein product [Clonostachys rosea]